eukprot:5950575-Pyramimonas_sp.AAC.1
MARSWRATVFAKGVFARLRATGPSRIEPGRAMTRRDGAYRAPVVVFGDVTFFLSTPDLWGSRRSIEL